jgi:acyl-CoA reductase-like NAD-dependent aldehyde dehydrogenase
LEGPAQYEIGHFIDGATIAGTADRWGDVAQPATGENQERVAFASTEEVDQAIDAGERAFGEWSSLTAVQRAAIMFKVRELLRRLRDELATLLGREHGKVWDDAQGELARGFEVVDLACRIPRLLNIAIPVPLAFHSLGGWKRSLFGGHHIYGPEGVRFFTRVKTMPSRWPTGVRTGPDLTFPSST